MAIRMIEGSGVDYEVIDITEDGDAYSYVKNGLGANSTPVIEWGEEVVYGFTPETKPHVRKLIELESAPTVHGDGVFQH
ncbi:glutaredoxin family protein [Nocardia terpenica]|nr:glutaredoxin family protein [Nocardia terpenica]